MNREDTEAVWSAFEKAIEHIPADTMHKPVETINKLMEARLALRSGGLSEASNKRPQPLYKVGESLNDAASQAIADVLIGNATATESIAVQAIANCIPLDPSVLDPELDLRLKRSGL